MSALEKPPLTTLLTTLEDYESLPKDIQAEIFNGEIFYMSSPSQIHQELLLEISVLIRDYIKKNKGDCKVLPAPFDVKLSDSPLTIVQPDIMVVCNKNKLDGMRCNGAPDWIIEIVSAGNASHDYIKKLYYYENYGVREYWIVDPIKKRIMVNFFEEELLNETYNFNSKIKVNIYEDFYIDFSKLEDLLLY